MATKMKETKLAGYGDGCGYGYGALWPEGEPAGDCPDCALPPVWLHPASSPYIKTGRHSAPYTYNTT